MITYITLESCHYIMLIIIYYLVKIIMYFNIIFLLLLLTTFAFIFGFQFFTQNFSRIWFGNCRNEFHSAHQMLVRCGILGHKCYDVLFSQIRVRFLYYVSPWSLSKAFVRNTNDGNISYFWISTQEVFEFCRRNLKRKEIIIGLKKYIHILKINFHNL